jgi:hypothetical protein
LLLVRLFRFPVAVFSVLAVARRRAASLGVLLLTTTSSTRSGTCLSLPDPRRVPCDFLLWMERSRFARALPDRVLNLGILASPQISLGNYARLSGQPTAWY